MPRKEAYGYAAARIRAMECRFLDASSLGRLLETDDALSFVKCLGETFYAQSQADRQVSLDKLLETALLDAYTELSSFVPDKELIDIIRMQYDFSNIKVMLKSTFNVKSGGKRRYDLLTSLGSYPVDALISDIESENYLLLPFGLDTLYPQCIAAWEQNRDVLEVEKLLDRQMFAEMLRCALKVGAPEVTAWVKARIDGENLRTLLRLKRFGIDAASAAQFLHAGGSIDSALLCQMLNEPVESWARMIPFADVARVLEEIDTAAPELVTDLERTLDDYYCDMAAKCRYTPNTPGNVIAYLWSKEMEVKNLRMIFVSKSGDKESVRRLMRHVCA